MGSLDDSDWGLLADDATRQTPPWAAVYQQSQRWFKAGVFEAIVDDMRTLLLCDRRKSSKTIGSHLRYFELCNQRLKVVNEQATTVANAKKGAHCILPWTPWGTC